MSYDWAPWEALLEYLLFVVLLDWAPGEPENNPGETSRAFLHAVGNWTDDSKNQTRDMMVACLQGKLHTEGKLPFFPLNSLSVCFFLIVIADLLVALWFCIMII